MMMSGVTRPFQQYLQFTNGHESSGRRSKIGASITDENAEFVHVALSRNRRSTVEIFVRATEHRRNKCLLYFTESFRQKVSAKFHAHSLTDRIPRKSFPQFGRMGSHENRLNRIFTVDQTNRVVFSFGMIVPQNV